jgi:putative transcriptional regulator
MAACTLPHTLRNGALALLTTIVAAGAAAQTTGPAAEGSGSPDAEKSVVLVANAGLVPPYRGAVVLVGAMPGSGHVGVIINRPTPHTLDTLFPDDPASRRERSPVRLGGPVLANSLFAVVKSAQRPDPSGIAVGKALYLVAEAQTIDATIARGARDATYFLGVVSWAPGELAMEIAQGLWSLALADSESIMDAVSKDSSVPLPPDTPSARRTMHAVEPNLAAPATR